MSGEINIEKSLSKKEKYEQLIPQIAALIENENDLIANLANITSALKYGMNFFWVGFYFIKNNELVLGPFQGTVACTRIGFGKGVCGAAWKEKKVIIVDDIEKFHRHIACSSESKSEIVLPVFDNKKNVFAVMDIDSDKLSAFDKTDEISLGEIVKLIEKKLL